MASHILSWISGFLFVNRMSLRTTMMRKSAWLGSLIFAGCLLILFPFGIGTAALKRMDVCTGSFWVVSEFVAAMTVNRMFAAEQEAGALDFLLVSPLPASCILTGKIAFTAIQIFSLQVPIALLWIILYNIPNALLWPFVSTVIPIAFIFNLGTSAAGALIACVTARSLGRDILQPILFFPLQSGVILAAVSLSMRVMDPAGMAGMLAASAWWTILCSYPVLFVTLGLLASRILFRE